MNALNAAVNSLSNVYGAPVSSFWNADGSVSVSFADCSFVVFPAGNVSRV